jgi:hypothetical protein
MQLLLVRDQERLVSLIRVLPLGSVEVNSNSYWSDQAGFKPEGEDRPGQLAYYKQELANT